MTNPVFAIYYNNNHAEYTYTIIGPASLEEIVFARKMLEWATSGAHAITAVDCDPTHLRECLTDEGVDPEDIAPDIIDINQLR